MTSWGTRYLSSSSITSPNPTRHSDPLPQWWPSSEFKKSCWIPSDIAFMAGLWVPLSFCELLENSFYYNNTSTRGMQFVNSSEIWAPHKIYWLISCMSHSTVFSRLPWERSMCLSEQAPYRAEYVNRRHTPAAGGGGTAGQGTEHALP